MNKNVIITAAAASLAVSVAMANTSVAAELPKVVANHTVTQLIACCGGCSSDYCCAGSEGCCGGDSDTCGGDSCEGDDS